MKKLYYTLIVLMIAGLFTSCSEEVGLDTGATIKGVVTYVDGNAAGAFVYIKYDATAATAEYDQVTVADENGNYHFEGLNRGDYYLDATFTTSQGVEFDSPGYVVTVGAKDSEININFELE